MNVAAFYNDFSNQQLSASLIPLPGTTNSPAQVIVNDGESRIKGIEVDTSLGWSNFNLAIGYTYLNTKLLSYSPPAFDGYLPPTTGSLVGSAAAFAETQVGDTTLHTAS